MPIWFSVEEVKPDSYWRGCPFKGAYKKVGMDIEEQGPLTQVPMLSTPMKEVLETFAWKEIKQKMLASGI